ncbi:MAG TPA: hypothetical protein VJP86_09190 [Vicinamibacterales bacterium]|jgi:hypothetical protein|nr:hypothetical protein [Vicinamibacterales bacterium]
MKRAISSVIALAVVAVPRAALACPVCFGQSDSPMAISTNNGIVALLVVITGVLAAFASFFIHLARRAHLAEMPGPAQPAHFAAGSDPQEGTVQC